MITAENVDLSNCDREQIQYAGAILPHGVLATASESDWTVLQASVNCGEMLGVPAEDLLGQSIGRLFSAAQWSIVTERFARLHSAGLPSYLLRATLHDTLFDVFAHRYDGVVIFEFEKCTEEADESFQLQKDIHEALTTLQGASSLQTFLDSAVAQIRRFTGFDRVMAYKFMPDGTGWVRSESLAEDGDFAPFLGLHYPASDVPLPARRLFSLTWLRHQPDIDYTPVPITPATNPVTGKSLDLSCAQLRSVSLMYTGYLKNMGTRSSMVLSLMKTGKIWGLIACHHHRAPKHVPYRERMACEFVAHMVSLLISAKEDLDVSEYRVRLKTTERLLVENFSREYDVSTALLQRSPTALEFVNAGGAAVVVEGRVTSRGQTPAQERILQITKWLSLSIDREVFATDTLAGCMPEWANCKDVASGLLALRFARNRNDYVLWFRPEQIQNVNWAGDPQKPVDISSDGQRLMPRTSFALWKETVRLKSEPWSEMEIEAVSQLRSSILELVLRKADEIGKLYDNLERSHAQLDTFAYVASHDLKEPLRGISNYAEMLLEDYSEALDEEGFGRLQTISRLARRMDDLLDSLLEYSRVGRVDFADLEVDMNVVVTEAVDTLKLRIAERKVTIRVPKRLPSVRGDQIHLRELLTNLISNAVKYNDREEPFVEIGVSPDLGADEVVLYVRDNGIGIREAHLEQIFQIFRRLHARNEYGGGAGAGLTIAKKIVERHGGRIWVDSVSGQGTTFWFSLPTVKTA